MQTEEQIRNRLANVRAYFDATWATRELAAPTASELIWVLTGEEAMGEAYLDREYEIPEPTGSQSPAGVSNAGPATTATAPAGPQPTERDAL